MTQVILSAVGTAMGGPVGGAIGRTLGAYVDRQAIASLSPAKQVGPRLAGLSLTSTADGAPMAAVFGRARVSGQVIWAARFKERRVAARTGGGKGGGQRTESYRYSLSFAAALCEGPIDGVGRVWADGKPMDMTGVVMRVHTGADDQAPDPLIEAVEAQGVQEEAPAYRGTAYVVFEDLPLDPYGNRPPQLSFEVFRRPRVPGAPPALEERLRGVCLIPGAGEFVYATETVLRRDGLTVSTAETVNNTDGRPDLTVSLDQLAAQLPNVDHVTLVVSWFGDDLRCGQCAVRPGVEQAEKATIPFAWRAGGVGREDARLVSRTPGGGPAYGGTPADHTVLQAIAALKARGYGVTLYPFVMMDVAPGNGLPDPHGGAEQPPYPWRGRISCHPAPGRPGSPDKTAAASAQVAAFFGAAQAAQMSVGGGEVGWSGDAGWGFRRMVLHCAKLAALAGGVDGFLIGSELVGLTTVRSSASAYPAVQQLRTLAADVRGVLGAGAKIGYAADWTEYYGHQPVDGSGDVRFHLDPLWADAALDFVGVDYYPPLTDWREGEGHADARAGFEGPHDPAYLASRITAGEAFDWYYASISARAAQVRTPITDGAYGEPWVFRPKDLQGWWSHPHHDRPGGVRSAAPTGWTPGLKPMRLTEFGCPAVDKGANSPNLFYDPKSAESALPPFSTGVRDDLGQRRALEAVLAHFDDPANNPASSVYGGPMVEAASAWCWDARPFPDFPARAKVWADAPNWARGHWLNGRCGQAPVADLLAVLLKRGGVDPAACDLSGAQGLVTGFVVDRPMSLADAIRPLTQAFAFDLAEAGGRLTAVARDRPPALALGETQLALGDDGAAVKAVRTLEPGPDLIRVRFIDGEADYQTGQAISQTAGTPSRGGSAALDLPIVTGAGQVEAAGARLVARVIAERDQATALVGPLTALTVEPGDCVTFSDARRWRVVRVDADERPRLTLTAAEPPTLVEATEAAWSAPDPHRPPGPPAFYLLDLPTLEGAGDQTGPLIAAAAEPWRGIDVSAGPNASALTLRAQVEAPAVVGATLSLLPAGPLSRMDRATRLIVKVEGGALVSCSRPELLSGLNAAAVLSSTGEWEVLQFQTAELVASDTYVLSGLLRGQSGSDPAMSGSTPGGAPFVLLTPELARARTTPAERGLDLIWRAGPAGGPAGGLATTEQAFAWRGLAYRPLAPVRLRVRRLADGTLAISWIRRTREHGDSWEGEVPLAEETEAYRAELLSPAGDVVRAWETTGPAAAYTAAQQSADFPAGAPATLTITVRQRSAIWGWGAACRQALGV